MVHACSFCFNYLDVTFLHERTSLGKPNLEIRAASMNRFLKLSVAVPHLCCSGWRGGALLGIQLLWPGDFDLGWLGILRWACSVSVSVSQCVLLQLGDGSESNKLTPVGVVGLSSNVSSVSSGGVRYSLIACLLLRREFA